MPETISLMKQRILNMAIRGELVDQRPEEGNAEELLINVKEEKNKLIEDKKLKKKKTYPKVKSEEISFDIPNSWKFIRLGEISLIKGGKRVPKGMKLIDDKTPHAYLRVTDMKNHSIDQSSLKYLTTDVFEKIRNYTISSDDVYLTIAGTIGDVGLIPKELDDMNLTENACKISPIIINKDFLMYHLTSEYVQNQFREGFNQLAQPKLSIRTTQNTVISLPPVLEQKRIVSKIRELFTIIDKIAERKEDTLQTLQQIRQTALREAIRGKLVEQDKNDAPASELIKQINAEKNRLIKEKLIKKGKRLPVISQDSKPFEIPENWEWIRLGEVIELISGRDLKKSEYNDASSGIPYITGASNFSQSNIIVNRWTKSPKVISQKGDLLITVKGTIGEMTIQSLAEAHIARQVMAIRNVYDLNTNYLQIFLQSRIIELKSKAKSMIPGISRDDLLNFEFPLPPINEQNRIVKKIESIEKILLEMEDRLI